MANKCPLCGQALPETLDQNQLESRLEKLSVPFLRAEKAKLKEELEDRLAEARELGRKQAEMSLRAQITESKKAAAKSEKEFDRRLRIETDRARKDAERGMTQRLEHARRQLQEFERRRTAEIARIRKRGCRCRPERSAPNCSKRDRSERAQTRTAAICHEIKSAFSTKRTLRNCRASWRT